MNIIDSYLLESEIDALNNLHIEYAKVHWIGWDCFLTDNPLIDLVMSTKGMRLAGVDAAELKTRHNQLVNHEPGGLEAKEFANTFVKEAKNIFLVGDMAKSRGHYGRFVGSLIRSYTDMTDPDGADIHQDLAAQLLINGLAEVSIFVEKEGSGHTFSPLYLKALQHLDTELNVDLEASAGKYYKYWSELKDVEGDELQARMRDYLGLDAFGGKIDYLGGTSSLEELPTSLQMGKVI